jgi:hypothetical protein
MSIATNISLSSRTVILPHFLDMRWMLGHPPKVPGAIDPRL